MSLVVICDRCYAIERAIKLPADCTERDGRDFMCADWELAVTSKHHDYDLDFCAECTAWAIKMMMQWNETTASIERS